MKTCKRDDNNAKKNNIDKLPYYSALARSLSLSRFIHVLSFANGNELFLSAALGHLFTFHSISLRRFASHRIGAYFALYLLLLLLICILKPFNTNHTIQHHDSRIEYVATRMHTHTFRLAALFLHITHTHSLTIAKRMQISRWHQM